MKIKTKIEEVLLFIEEKELINDFAEWLVDRRNEK